MKKLKDILNEGPWDVLPHKDGKIYILHHELAKHYSDIDAKSMDLPHKKALDAYTNNSRTINDYHWKKAKGSRVPNENIDEKSRDLDSIIHSHKTPKKMVVYSGTKHDPREIKDENNIVHHPSYLSASLDKDVAKQFGDRLATRKGEMLYKHVLKIHVPEGHPGAYIAHSGLALKSEMEFMLPRGTNMKHIRTETKVDPEETMWRTTTHTHHMEVV